MPGGGGGIGAISGMAGSTTTEAGEPPTAVFTAVDAMIVDDGSGGGGPNANAGAAECAGGTATGGFDVRGGFSAGASAAAAAAVVVDVVDAKNTDAGMIGGSIGDCGFADSGTITDVEGGWV